MLSIYLSIYLSREIVILETGVNSSLLVAGGCSARVGVPHRPLLPALPTWLGAHAGGFDVGGSDVGWGG